MNERKVVAVIVEGTSDEIAIGSILKEYFSSAEVQFKVVYGDITSDINTTNENVIIRIGDLIESIRSKYGYRWEDFARIIHIADTDGVFAQNCVQESGSKKIIYYEDHMETSYVEEAMERNKHKAKILFKLYSTGKVHDVQYRIYFNSCNLEHVLYDQLKDFSDEEKEKLSDDFAEKYEGKVPDFIEFISNPFFAVSGTYKETWKYIEKDKNSLHRHTNMHLIFNVC